jgi:hypothetical protein
MSTDRELLELAAKAAGYTTNHPWNAERLTFNPPVDALYVMNETGCVHTAWNPLDDSGAAMNLAVDLDLAIIPYPIYNKQKHSVLVQKKNLDESRFEKMELHGDDPRAATCRAIVRVAAAIGEAMP